MFLLRLKPFSIFLLLIIPMLAGGIFQAAPYFTSVNTIRLQIIGVNISTIFAVLFTAWMATLTWAIAPGMTRRSFLIAGLSLSMAFRAWQDSWSIDALLLTGKMPAIEDVPLFSPLFVLHALVSLFILYLLVMLAVWLVRREKAIGIQPQSLGITILQFMVFPVGLFWTHKRARALHSIG